MTIVFVHIPKTAGTTLKSIIYRLYRSNQVLSEYTAQSPSCLEQHFRTVATERQLAIKVVLGHFPYDSYSWLEKRPTYVTVLRNPLDRLISHYHFVKSTPSHYLHKTVTTRNMSLEEYVASSASWEMDNGQTRMICGSTAMNIPLGQCTEDMLREAKYNLRNGIAVVGLTEDFDRTVILMKRMFGWGWPFYVPKNRTRNRPNRTQVTPEAIQIIEKYNHLDIELHAYARELFDTRVQEEGNSFEQDVQRFKRMNTTIGRFYCHLNDARRIFFKNIK